MTNTEINSTDFNAYSKSKQEDLSNLLQWVIEENHNTWADLVQQKQKETLQSFSPDQKNAAQEWIDLARNLIEDDDALKNEKLNWLNIMEESLRNMKLQDDTFQWYNILAQDTYLPKTEDNWARLMLWKYTISNVINLEEWNYYLFQDTQDTETHDVFVKCDKKKKTIRVYNKNPLHATAQVDIEEEETVYDGNFDKIQNANDAHDFLHKSHQEIISNTSWLDHTGKIALLKKAILKVQEHDDTPEFNDTYANAVNHLSYLKNTEKQENWTLPDNFQRISWSNYSMIKSWETYQIADAQWNLIKPNIESRWEALSCIVEPQMLGNYLYWITENWFMQIDNQSGEINWVENENFSSFGKSFDWSTWALSKQENFLNFEIHDKEWWWHDYVILKDGNHFPIWFDFDTWYNENWSWILFNHQETNYTSFNEQGELLEYWVSFQELNKAAFDRGNNTISIFPPNSNHNAVNISHAASNSIEYIDIHENLINLINTNTTAIMKWGDQEWMVLYVDKNNWNLYYSDWLDRREDAYLNFNNIWIEQKDWDTVISTLNLYAAPLRQDLSNPKSWLDAIYYGEKKLTLPDKYPYVESQETIVEHQNGIYAINDQWVYSLNTENGYLLTDQFTTLKEKSSFTEIQEIDINENEKILTFIESDPEIHNWWNYFQYMIDQSWSFIDLGSKFKSQPLTINNNSIAIKSETWTYTYNLNWAVESFVFQDETQHKYIQYNAWNLKLYTKPDWTDEDPLELETNQLEATQLINLSTAINTFKNLIAADGAHVWEKITQEWTSLNIWTNEIDLSEYWINEDDSEKIAARINLFSHIWTSV